MARRASRCRGSGTSLAPNRLRIERHQFQDFLGHVRSNGQAHVAGLIGRDGIVVGPGARRQLRRYGRRAVLVHLVGQQTFRECLDLRDGLTTDIGHDQGLVVDLGDRFLLDDLDERGSGQLAKLRIDGSQHGVFAHHDLVGSECDQRATGHRVMWHEHCDLALVSLNGAGNLGCRKHKAARRMQHDVERHLVVGHLDCAQYFFGVVDVDVAHQGKAQQVHRLLSMDQQDDATGALLLDLGDLACAHRLKIPALQNRLQRRNDEEQPEQLHYVHGPSPPSRRPSGRKP